MSADANAKPAKLPTPLGFRLLDWGLVPDPALRLVCTLRTRNRLKVERAGTIDDRSERKRRMREDLSKGAVATHTAEANSQHYEVPTAFYDHVLGARRKYSSCYFPNGDETLDEAEVAMLELYGERAGLTDGQRILELGCGWGSFCLWAAERYPASEIVTVSNSRTQRQFIEGEAARLGLTNLTVLTDDITTFDPADHGEPGPFDRIVSVEMLEHVRNHEQLFGRISRWLAPDGRFFTHIFTGADVGFRYDADDPRDWMGRYFFSGGIMPSDDLFLHLQGDLVCTDHWQLSGVHYEKTANAWIDNLNANKAEVLAVLAADGGARHAKVWFRRWTAFFMGCAQLWGYRDGQDFGVSHYLFAPRPRVD
ncbi:cyclopropane-fatty-acyl-phospholipid synthase family protein [Aquihabitans sp. G128]|uniref:SAM-dependent methyltransferase n=1 Tax=Aquihabitans sp. G128 TaxID=2849779 RepID=UPI001C224A9C|nr:cyclopropane-fatty-acyl-phospholipid synthase family protein [Aquihabitans sp. G128]QXC62983.1 cyclopropane-fatty-acyl-phospholipid synthase family protein [Aquihabitans sp. G128]